MFATRIDHQESTRHSIVVLKTPVSVSRARTAPVGESDTMVEGNGKGNLDSVLFIRVGRDILA